MHVHVGRYIQVSIMDEVRKTESYAPTYVTGDLLIGQYLRQLQLSHF